MTFSRKWGRGALLDIQIKIGTERDKLQVPGRLTLYSSALKAGSLCKYEKIHTVTLFFLLLKKKVM